MTKFGEWVTRGFDSFRKGTFGNARQNLYVFRRGVLQRIFQYDLNQNGYFDIVFCVGELEETNGFKISLGGIEAS